ncbi:MAG: Bug family tripartite tricarboxylate transporter substrate binding protein [Beijerinckiaceae bacterium]
MKKLAGAVNLIAAFQFAAGAAFADDFYLKRQVNMIVGSAPGGGYDIYARLVARHLPKFIDGTPTIVVQNLPAAGSLVAMNTLANSAPRDGSTIGAVQNHIGVEPVLGITGPTENARFDGRRMNWLGSTSREVPVVVAWGNSPIQTFKDVLQREMIVGSSGVATADAVYARVLNELVGSKFKIIDGYKSASDLTLAAESGEVMGRAGWFVSGMLASHAQQIADGKIRVLVQLDFQKHPGLPNVPTIGEFLSDPLKRQQLELSLSYLAAGRPFVAPPDVPAGRVKILRDAFMAAVKSPDYLAEAGKMRLDTSPMAGEDVQKLVERIYATPPDVVKSVRAIMSPK